MVYRIPFDFCDINNAKVQLRTQPESKIFFLFEKDLLSCIRKADLQRDGVTEGKMFHVLIYSANGHSGQSCADRKPRARSFFSLGL